MAFGRKEGERVREGGMGEEKEMKEKERIKEGKGKEHDWSQVWWRRNFIYKYVGRHSQRQSPEWT